MWQLFHFLFINFFPQHYLAIGRRFLDAIMLWSNPDDAWVTASLEYLRNLYDSTSKIAFSFIYIECRYSEKECKVTEDSQKPEPTLVSSYSATKTCPSESTSIAGRFLCSATPPVANRLMSAKPFRSIVRTATHAVKKK